MPGPYLSSWEHLNSISVIFFGMSDDLPIVATRKFNRTRSKNNRFNTISYMDIKNQDKDAFVESLKTAPWDCAFLLTTKTSKTQKSTQVVQCQYFEGNQNKR